MYMYIGCTNSESNQNVPIVFVFHVHEIWFLGNRSLEHSVFVYVIVMYSKCNICIFIYEIIK